MHSEKNTISLSWMILHPGLALNRQGQELSPTHRREDECNRLLNEAALRQKNRKSFRSVNWVITLRRRYDDPTSPAHAGRAPAAQLLRWNHSIVPPARRRIRQHFHRSPDQLGAEDIRRYQRFLIHEKKLAWSSYDQIVCALRFFYAQTLKRAFLPQDIPTEGAATSSDPQPGGSSTNPPHLRISKVVPC